MVVLVNGAGFEALCISIDHNEMDLHPPTLVGQILFRQCWLGYSEALVECVEVERHLELYCIVVGEGKFFCRMSKELFSKINKEKGRELRMIYR